MLSTPTLKSILTYLTLSVLFLTGFKLVTAQKQYAGSMDDSLPTDPTANTRFFTGQFVATGNSLKTPPFQMRLELSDNYIKGSYRLANSHTDVDLIGAVNSQNELILIESAAGKTTGAFKGILENGANSRLRLSGIWSNVENTNSHHFSLDEVP